MSWKVKLFICLAFVAALSFGTVQFRKAERLSEERDSYRRNTEVLMTDIETYRVRDSLSAARVHSLELSISEYERYRAEDADLIKSLKAKNHDLASVNKAQSETIIALYAMPRDTVIIRDSVPIQAVAVHCGDEWYDFEGLLTDSEFSGTMTSRDSLMIVESVKYHRFLGFLWKTSRVDDRTMDCVAKNPHTNILGLEYVVIEK